MFSVKMPVRFRSMTCLTSSFRSQILGKFSQCKSISRNFSIQASPKLEKATVKRAKRNAAWISPPLTALRIQEIKSVTGIVTGLSYISWLKMSVPDQNVLDWEIKMLPADFAQQKDESSLLALAYDLQNSLPPSDLYVMESSSLRECRQYSGTNKIQLSSMLMVLLNGSNKDENWKETVIFQKKFVMNFLYNIQIAAERVTTRTTTENILLKSTYLLSECDLKNDTFSALPSIKVDHEFVEMFKESELEKQENLSLALLLTLSFIDVNLLRNESSIEKIRKRRRHN